MSYLYAKYETILTFSCAGSLRIYACYIYVVAQDMEGLLLCDVISGYDVIISVQDVVQIVVHTLLYRTIYRFTRVCWITLAQIAARFSTR